MEIKGIAIDLDGTVFNTIKRICELYNEDFCLYEDFVPIDWQSVKTWEFKELFLETPENIDKYFCQPRFFKELRMYGGAKWIIDKLSKNHHILFVSHGLAPNLIMKKAWVRDNFPYADFIGVEINKHKDKSSIDLSGYIFIDDVALNLETSNALLKICYGLEYPWNDKWNGIRCEEWVEVFGEVMKYENKIQNN